MKILESCWSFLFVGNSKLKLCSYCKYHYMYHYHMYHNVADWKKRNQTWIRAHDLRLQIRRCIYWVLVSTLPVTGLYMTPTPTRFFQNIEQQQSNNKTSKNHWVHIQTTISSWQFRYRANIVHIDVISCLHRLHRNINDDYLISTRYRTDIVHILSTSWTSRSEQCINDLFSTSFTSMHYRIYIVVIAKLTTYTRNDDVKDVDKVWQCPDFDRILTRYRQQRDIDDVNDVC